MNWSVVYEKAIRDDGSLLFPERLTHEFLQNARKTMGSYFFSNQYQNQVLPDDERRFKLEWIRYYKAIPANTFRFGFIDPAIGQNKHSDYTAIVIVDVDSDGQWYLRVANRYRITPTAIISKMFEVCEQFQLKSLGVEIVAYQEALLYMLSEEMRKRNKVIPVSGIRRTAITKEARILSLVPRFEWGRISIAPGLTDLEDEYSTFPRGTHDDLLDALSSIEEIVFYPKKEEQRPYDKPHNPHDPNYERWVIQKLVERQRQAD